MKKSTILELNKINRHFYSSVAKEFNESREFYWHGWREFLPYLTELIARQESLSILDIGCGNGRFGKFLVDNLPAVPIAYTGIDYNKTLLQIAEEKLSATHLDSNFQQTDIVDELLHNTFLDNGHQYDVIVSFGVIHHIPSYELRQAFFKVLKKKVSKNGLIILTLWRFMDIARLERKQLPFNNTDINPQELEQNDYLIGWYRGKKTYRYCHYTDEREQQQLVKEAGLKILDSFEADGREGKGNTYLVLN